MNPTLLRYGIRQSNDRQSSAKLWRNKGGARRHVYASLIGCLCLGACANGVEFSLPGAVGSNLAGGIVAGDEPRSVLVAKDILDSGGTAADAAVALAFATAVTLQSSSGLGGGGLCTVFDAASGDAESLVFPLAGARGRETLARWQVAVPALARGMFALHAKHGELPWQALVVPAENLSRFGVQVTRAMAEDLSQASDSLVNDPEALDNFTSQRRTLLAEGDRFRQLDMAAVFGRMRARTPGDFYTGALSRSIDDGALTTGASLNVNDLRSYTPVWSTPRLLRFDDRDVYVSSRGVDEAQLRTTLTQPSGDTGARVPFVPSATSFVVADARGNAVACSLTMGQPFGVGIMLDGLGFLLAPSPEVATPPPLFSLIGVNRSTGQVTFAAATAGKGGDVSLSMSLTSLLQNKISISRISENESLASRDADQRPAPVNAFLCRDGVLAGVGNCTANQDPDGDGFGLITFGRR